MSITNLRKHVDEELNIGKSVRIGRSAISWIVDEYTVRDWDGVITTYGTDKDKAIKYFCEINGVRY